MFLSEQYFNLFDKILLHTFLASLIAYLPEISGRDILLFALPPAAVIAEACEVTEAA